MLTDIRSAFRALGRNKASTVSACLTLALALAASAAVFSIANTLLIRPFPFPRSRGLVSVGEISPMRKDFWDSISPSDFAVLRKRTDLFDGLAATTDAVARIRTRGIPEEIVGKQVSPEFFRMTGIRPIRGSLFTESDAAASAPRVALISFGLWLSRFGGSPDVLGKSLSVDDDTYRIAGVLGPELRRFDRAEFWIPLRLAENAPNGRIRYLEAIGLLRPTVSMPACQSALAVLARNLENTFPETNRGYSFQLQTLRRHLIGDFETPLRILMICVGAFWIIACVNVSNLFLARAVHRSKETAIRLALGASFRRIARYWITESLLVSLVAGALAIPIAIWLLAFLRVLAPPLVWQLGEVSLDWRVLTFGIGFAGGTAVVLGLAPTWWSTRSSPQAALAGARPSGSPFGARGIGAALVVVEIAFALPLVAGAGLMVESLWRLYRADLGVRSERVTIADIRIFHEPRYAGAAAQRDLFTRILENVRRLPEIESAGLVLFNPVPRGPKIGRRFRIEGAPPLRPEDLPEASVFQIDPGYLSMMKVPLLAGRPLSDSDPADANPVSLLVSQAFARQYSPSRSLLGRNLEIQFPHGIERGRIVGIVGDVASWPEIDRRPTIYMSYLQHPLGVMTLVVRSRLESASPAEAIQKAVAQIDPELPVRDIRSLRESLDIGVAIPRFVAALLKAFSVLALVLAGAGIYSVVTYLVEQRRKEIGIRTAVGAQTNQIVRLIVGSAARWAVAGVSIGVLVALALARFLAGFLYGVKPVHGLMLAAAAAVLLAAELLGAYFPARRAARRNPLEVLRND